MKKRGADMKIVVQAAGALGLLIAWFLHDKNEVVCVSRKRLVDVVSKDGLEVKFGGENRKKMLNIVETADAVGFNPELVILACKSFDSDENLNIIKEHWPETKIMTIQNGIYTEYRALELFRREQLFPASVLIGSKFIGISRLEQFFDYGMKVGSLGDSEFLEKLLKLLRESNIRVEKSDNIMRDKWQKFMFYCSSATVNAITATKELSYEHTRWIVKRAIEEIAAVGANMELDFDVNRLAQETFEFCMQFKPDVWNASVGVDLRKGKRTEIDYLNGYVVELGRRFNIDVPVNETLFRLVKTLEKTGLFAKFI